MTALPASSANRGSTVMEDYAAALNARGQILQLDTGDMFGERIGLFTGSVEFLQTDVDLPGNSALEVGIKRRLVAGAQGRQGLGMFGVWDLALPRVHGTFSTQGDGRITWWPSRSTAVRSSPRLQPRSSR
ncbi:hypothetical protein AR274_11090 [Stenotrophomonas maltophilia]|nr:hypothetical protein AR274_11090 [Stenotrophomonas maltophilia]